MENRRSVVRSTNGGMTVIVDPNGRILQMLEPFVEATLVGEVPVVRTALTPYTLFGDWLARACLAVTLGVRALCLVLLAADRVRGRADGDGSTARSSEAGPG